MKALTTVAIVLLFVGCATAPAPAPTTAGAQMFTGEVWTWDQPNNIVTLYQGGKITRVKTTPEQMRALRLHENARVTGELAPPDRKALTTVAIVLLFVGCATAPAPAPTTAGAQMFTGEVWTWDQPNNIVTLYQGGKITRVKTTPEQMRALRLHENARVTGELAP